MEAQPEGQHHNRQTHSASSTPSSGGPPIRAADAVVLLLAEEIDRPPSLKGLETVVPTIHVWFDYMM